ETTTQFCRVLLICRYAVVDLAIGADGHGFSANRAERDRREAFHPRGPCGSASRADGPNAGSPGGHLFVECRRTHDKADGRRSRRTEGDEVVNRFRVTQIGMEAICFVLLAVLNTRRKPTIANAAARA